MPSSVVYNTWNRFLSIAVNFGGLDADEFMRRTLSITYVDRDKEFDWIEWKLDNRDGALTQPENIALGLVISIKLGYTNAQTEWKTFIIKRLKGGVGVIGNDGQFPINENEAVITYEGQNRNAPGGKAPRGKSRSAQRSKGRKSSKKLSLKKGSGKAWLSSKKGKQIYAATKDILNTEMSMNEKRPKLIMCPSTSEGIITMARRAGYREEQIFIENTEDSINYLSIPTGVTEKQFIEALADQFGYIHKADKNSFHFHSPTWAGAPLEVVADLTYGDGRDILKVDIDADFRLPIPNGMKAKGYDFNNRVGVINLADYDQQSGKAGFAVGGVKNFVKDPIRSQTLTRLEEFPATGNYPTISAKMKKRFIQRNWAAFQLNVDIVGNPVVLARKLLRMRGTGSPLVDGVWYIMEARHTFSETTYTTTVKLKHPPKTKKAQPGKTKVGVINNPDYDQKSGKAGFAVGGVKNYAVKRTNRN